VDFTIADLVADVRAPTPSGAAELVVPEWREWLRNVQRLRDRATRTLLADLRRVASSHDALAARLRRIHPGFVLRQHAQRLDDLTERARAALARLLALREVHARHLHTRLARATPVAGIREREARRAAADLRLGAAARLHLRQLENRLAVAAAGLNAVSPLRTLDRGYAIVTDAASGGILQAASSVQVGQRVHARLASGSFDATVSKIESDPTTE